MAITTTNRRNDYIGTGITGPYAYTYKIFAATDLVVTTRDTSGSETTLVYPTDYSVTGVGDSVGGSITLTAALTTGYALTIRRVRPLTQTTSVRNQGTFFPETHEDTFDKLVMIDQQQQDEINRAFKLPETFEPSDYDLTLTPIANEVLAWDTDGSTLTSYPVSTFGATASSILTGIINVKDVGATGGGLIDDQAALAAAQAAVGAVGALYFPPGTYKIGSDLTFTASIWLAPGARLKPASGINVTISGAFLDPGLTQVFDESAGGNIDFGWLGGAPEIDRSTDYVRPEWWGAKADNATSSTSAMNAAINQAVRVKLSKGIYLANCIHTWGYVVVDGAGMDSTFIQSETTTGYAWSERFAGSGWKRHATLNDLCLLGDGALRNGFVFGTPGVYTSGAEQLGRCEFNRVAWKATKIGMYKQFGNIGNVYNDCTWWGTEDYCYYAVGRNSGVWHASASTMQAGADTFNGGHMEGASLAAIYIDDNSSSAGANVFNDLIVESCAGFGWFVKSYANQAAGPLVINNCWVETTASAGSVTIDGDVYTPRYYYFKDAKHVVILNSKITNASMELVNAKVRETGCVYNQEVLVMDADSVRIVENAFLSYATLQKGVVRSVEGIGEAFGGTGIRFTVEPRATKVYGYTPVWQESYDGAGPWLFQGTANTNATSVADGLIYATCAELVIPDTYTLMPATGFTFTNGKYYVYSIDVKQLGADAPTEFSSLYGGTFFPDASPLLVQDKWVTIGGIQRATSTNTSALPRIVNNSGSSVTLRFSAAQVVEFDTEQDAIDFFNARLYQDT